MANVTSTSALIRIREMGVAQAHCQSECDAWIEAINTARTLAEAEYIRNLNLTRRAHSWGGSISASPRPPPRLHSLPASPSHHRMCVFVRARCVRESAQKCGMAIKLVPMLLARTDTL